MPVILLSIAMLIISIIFKLAAVFRLTIPLLYVIAMNNFGVVGIRRTKAWVILFSLSSLVW